LKRVIGKWGLNGTSNVNEIRTTDFVTDNNTIIIRYILATQNIQKGTVQPLLQELITDGKYIGRWKACVKHYDVRICGGEDCDTDHHLFSLNIDIKYQSMKYTWCKAK
jgi:hypothetical protein